MERLTERDGLCVKAKFTGDFGTQNILHKLADYEDLEEQGLLLKLPCKVGTLVYEAYCLKSGISGVDEHRLILEDIPKFNKTVFLTKEEALSKLKELENEWFN